MMAGKLILFVIVGVESYHFCRGDYMMNSHERWHAFTQALFIVTSGTKPRLPRLLAETPFIRRRAALCCLLLLFSAPG
jgi:hypothetical protein